MRAARVGCAAAALALVALVGPAAGRATAACHAFGVSAAPASPTEGDSVTVTVTRDNDFQHSSVRLRTRDGSATAGPDYEPIDTRVEFTGTSATVTLAIHQDGIDEPTETLTLHLSEAAGCEINQNFSYGGPATVSIQDDDSPPAPPAPPSPPSPPPPPAPPAPPDVSGGTGGGITPTPLDDADDASTSSTATTGATIDGEQAADDGDDDDGGGAAWVVAALAIAAVGGAGGYLAYRRRPTG